MYTSSTVPHYSLRLSPQCLAFCLANLYIRCLSNLVVISPRVHVFGCMVQVHLSLLQDVRRKVARIVATKCALAARVDSFHEHPDGTAGKSEVLQIY